MCKVTPPQRAEHCASPAYLSDIFLDALTVQVLIELAFARAESPFQVCMDLDSNCSIETGLSTYNFY